MGAGIIAHLSRNDIIAEENDEKKIELENGEVNSGFIEDNTKM